MIARLSVVACTALIAAGCFASHEGDGPPSLCGLGRPCADGGRPGPLPREVGAACVPSSVPFGGFVSSEVYLEGPGRTCGGDAPFCIVYQLEGDPRPACSGTACADPAEVERRVFCSCRCDTDTPGASLCDCPSGFRCENVLDLGGPDIRGSYCIRSGI